MKHGGTGHSQTQDDNTIALILAGGAGTRLHCLTQCHAKPAIHFAGKYRAIDFSLSNCLHSGIRRISVLTQYKSHSLNLHLQQGWSFLRPELNEYVEILPAQQRINGNWYAGTADAVYQNLDIIADQNPRYVVLLAGDHIYKMDYRQMLHQHVNSRSDMTLACLEVPLEEAKGFGVIQMNDIQHIVNFEEKPINPRPIPGQPQRALVSMGIYIFNWLFLRQILLMDAADSLSGHDFGKDIIPRWISKARLGAYQFRDNSGNFPGYWRDIGTIDAYFNAHMDLLQKNAPLNLYDRDWPIFSYSPFLPPAHFMQHNDNVHPIALDSMICEGAVIAGAHVRNSVISINVNIANGAHIDHCVVLPGAEIGAYCKLKNVIVDCNCKIPPGTVIGYEQEKDREAHLVSPKGITVVAANAPHRSFQYDTLSIETRANENMMIQVA